SIELLASQRPSGDVCVRLAFTALAPRRSDATRSYGPLDGHIETLTLLLPKTPSILVPPYEDAFQKNAVLHKNLLKIAKWQTSRELQVHAACANLNQFGPVSGSALDTRT